MDLVVACYRLTASFPKDELYGITSQIRRAAVSIPSNLAEGHSRRSTGAYINHVSIALGSHGELETCIEIAGRLGFVSAADVRDVVLQSDSVGRLLYGLHKSLERKNYPPG
jgi:four helix bundle protein